MTSHRERWERAVLYCTARCQYSKITCHPKLMTEKNNVCSMKWNMVAVHRSGRTPSRLSSGFQQRLRSWLGIHRNEIRAYFWAMKYSQRDLPKVVMTIATAAVTHCMHTDICRRSCLRGRRQRQHHYSGDER